eukprot:XP_002257503.1 hypothetical protein, conserved in Plasmodium species [Plasmodium knowlesi strain H]
MLVRMFRITGSTNPYTTTADDISAIKHALGGCHLNREGYFFTDPRFLQGRACFGLKLNCPFDPCLDDCWLIISFQFDFFSHFRLMTCQDMNHFPMLTCQLTVHIESSMEAK